MLRQCKICGTVEDYKAHKAQGSSPEAHHFCRVACLHAYLNTTRFSEHSTQKLVRQYAIPLPVASGDHYCIHLNQHFKSVFERDVARYLRLVLGYDVLYEAHGIPVNVRGETKTYCPDFFFPRHGLWIEAKGHWRGDARIKFLSALDTLGKDRVLLVPYMHAGMMAGLTKRFA